MGYALFYCIAWAYLRQGGWASVLFMAPAALLSAVCAIDVSASTAAMFRRAAEGTVRRHVIATLAQIVLFWSFFLYVVPSTLLILEKGLGAPSFTFAGQSVLGLGLLVAFSSLGLWSGMTIAGHGRGTPLPFDATNRLVIEGPYGYVRNPMVIAGLGQGASVGVLWGSWIVLAYVALGAGIWQWIVRPAEERDLGATFGEDYSDYVRYVRCWAPRRSLYEPSGSVSTSHVRAGGLI
jgi:protein-S-isoprenylcysteine O-methyltransferase Ste14